MKWFCVYFITKDFFSQASSIEGLEERFEEVPNKFGTFSIIDVEQNSDNDDEDLKNVLVNICNHYVSNIMPKTLGDTQSAILADTFIS